MPPARERTTLPRVLVAVATAFLTPPLIWIVFAIAFDPPPDPSQALVILVRGVVASVLVGWILVLPACATWAVLQAFDRHYVWSALVVGVATGGALGLMASIFMTYDPEARLIALACTATGAVTGLAVWWVAYGRQDRLPKPTVTRPPLAL